MIGPSANTIVSTSLGKAIAVSAAAHVAALTAAAFWSFGAPSDEARLARPSGVVRIEMTLVEPEPQIPAIEMVATNEPVVIMPRQAFLADHRFIDVPAADVPPETIEVVLDADLVQRHPPVSQRQPLPAPPSNATNEPVAPPKPVAVKPPPSKPQASGVPVKSPPDFAGNRPPHYPLLARQRGWQGTVVLRLFIAPTGAVTKVEIARSSGHEILDAAAASTIRNWRGAPARRNGKPVSTVELLPVRFRM